MRMNERRLSDLQNHEVFYVQLYKTIPIYEFIERISEKDTELLIISVSYDYIENMRLLVEIVIVLLSIHIIIYYWS